MMRTYVPLLLAIAALSAFGGLSCKKKKVPYDYGGMLPPTASAGSPTASASGDSSSAPHVKATTVATPPAIGPRAPGPPPEKVDHALRCSTSTKFTIGQADPIPSLPTYVPTFALAFGPNDGLVAFEKSRHHLVVVPVARDGHATGAPHALDTPATLDRLLGVRRLADVYVVFLNEMNFGGDHLTQSVYAAVFKPDGTPVGVPALLDIGTHAAVKAASPAAAHGFMLYEGPTTTGLPARLVTALVGADGSVTQSAVDLAIGLKPGVLAPDPEFSLSAKHAAVRVDEHVAIDGKLLTITGGDASTPEYSLSETMDDKGIPVVTSVKDSTAIMAMLGADGTVRDAKQVGTKEHAAPSVRYGRIDLDGALHFDAKAASPKDPIRAPFTEEADWTITGNMGGPGAVVELEATTSLRHAPLVAHFLSLIPEITSGMWTKVAWSGEQYVMIYSEGATVRTAKLWCHD